MKGWIDTLPTASPALLGCLVLIGLLGVVTLGGFFVTIFRDILGAIFNLEFIAFAVMALALAMVAYYFMYG